MPPVSPLILLVDDTEEIRQVWRRLLTAAGFRVIEAVHGEDGVRKALDLRPDLIVMDIAMPVLNGIDATRQLKADPATTAVPILAVSADTVDEESREAGCDAFLPKPVRHGHLLSEVRRLLREVGTAPVPA